MMQIDVFRILHLMVLNAGQEIAIRIRTEADLTGMRGLGRNINRLRSELNHLAIGFGAVGTGAAIALRDIVKTVNNFETQINRVQAAANATSREIGTLRAQAKLLGRTTAFTASQSAEAQFRLAQSGYEVNETMRLMPDVLNVAAAGLLSMEESGRIVTNQIATYNLSVEQATRVSDVLALTAASSKTSISELGTSFRYAAPSAAAVGISIEETAAAIGILRDRGLVAEQAGTGLRFNILRLVRPVASATEVFKELGISQEETAKKIEAGKLLEVFKEFGEAGMTLNQAGRMFDVRAAGSALILADAADEAIRLRDALLSADGAAKRMAETQMQGLPGALLRMTSAIESMKIAPGRIWNHHRCDPRRRSDTHPCEHHQRDAWTRQDGHRRVPDAGGRPGSLGRCGFRSRIRLPCVQNDGSGRQISKRRAGGRNHTPVGCGERVGVRDQRGGSGAARFAGCHIIGDAGSFEGEG